MERVFVRVWDWIFFWSLIRVPCMGCVWQLTVTVNNINERGSESVETTGTRLALTVLLHTAWHILFESCPKYGCAVRAFFSFSTLLGTDRKGKIVGRRSLLHRLPSLRSCCPTSSFSWLGLPYLRLIYFLYSTSRNRQSSSQLRLFCIVRKRFWTSWKLESTFGGISKLKQRLH